MIQLSQLREYMAEQGEEDKKARSVQVEAESIEDALGQAAVELGVPVESLEYEVEEKGDRGFLGAGKRSWVLRVYEAARQVTIPGIEEEAAEAEAPVEEVIKDRDGKAIVRLTQDGVFLKVTRPVGKGRRANEQQALDAIRDRHVTEFDKSLVAKVVRRADEEYVRVGDFEYRPANDAIMNVDISGDEMKAYMEVAPPGPGGTDMSLENMMTVLQNHGVYHGIKEDVLRAFEDFPDYNTSVLVAEGTPARNGDDARIDYNFNTRRNIPVLKEKDGRVDFKELNLVENVVAGQILARKIPAGDGEPGTTVTGREIPAREGRDTSIEVGKNVKLAEDGLTALSEINGQVFLTGRKIIVEPIYTVNGDVNLHTGNVLFLGTVIVKGNVEDGFSVKAAGNIEVLGNVGNCVIDAEGDVIVHQGILGKTRGKVRTSSSVFAKFIEHAHIEAGDAVVAGEGIIHSFVDANKRIICQGRRASIVGGRLRAAEEINAKHLGSVAGSETILEVGYDPKSKERMVQIENVIAERMKEIEELELNIKTLNNIKKTQKKLPEEKEQYLQELQEKRASCEKEIDEGNREMEEIRYRLDSIKLEGKVSASDKVFPGVKVFIREANLEVRNEFKAVTFIQEKGNIKVTKYEPIQEEPRIRR